MKLHQFVVDRQHKQRKQVNKDCTNDIRINVSHSYIMHVAGCKVKQRNKVLVTFSSPRQRTKYIHLYIDKGLIDDRDFRET